MEDNKGRIMITDLTLLKDKLEQIYGDSIKVANAHSSILGSGDYSIMYDVDILKAIPSGIQIFPKYNDLFRIELYLNDIHSHISSSWDWFGITDGITEDDIIRITGELLSKTTAKDVYDYCHGHAKLTDGYCPPHVEVAPITRKDNISKRIKEIDTVITYMRHNKDVALPSSAMVRVILPPICSIIEIIGRYANRCDKNTEPTKEAWHVHGKSKEFFKAGLPTKITTVLTDDEQNELYANMRCALVHAGEPLGNIKIGTYITTDIKNNTYNVYELWDLIKCRWSEICVMPTIHSTGGIAFMECQYGDNANIIAI